MWDFNLNLVDVPFDVGSTLNCGQAFRWAEHGGSWYGVVGKGVLKVRQEGFTLFCSSSSEELDARFAHSYFRLGDDFEAILSSIPKDQTLSDAFERFRGLRLIRQDVWECLLSFVLATNANIPRIKGMISNLCERFGERVSFDGIDYRLFPTAERLAGSSVQELAACGLGYRARFVRDIAWTVDSGSVNLDELRLHDYPRAREILLERILEKKTFLGIGRKVADCVLLFSCDNKDEAFPIDVWIARVLAGYYPHLFDEEVMARLSSKVSGKSSLSEKTYDAISVLLRAGRCRVSAAAPTSVSRPSCRVWSWPCSQVPPQLALAWPWRVLCTSPSASQCWGLGWSFS
jgi:N-glycosylase/DNA lyase